MEFFMDILEKADTIMEGAVQKAGEILDSSPKIAEIILKQLLRCDPENLAGLQLFGLCKHRMGKHVEAIEIIQLALDIDPECADNWNNIGLAYAALGNFKKAIESIEKAIELFPENILFKNNLALQYRSLGDYNKSIEVMKEAIAVKPTSQLWTNLGGIYGEMREIEKAKNCFNESININPSYTQAYINMAFANLLQGDWENGFAAYEWRFSYYPQIQFYLNAYDADKKWDGIKDINGKRVIVYGEQGLGDIIQFVRYVEKLKSFGPYVIVHCPQNLKSLLQRIKFIDEITTKDIVNVNEEEKFPDYDYQFAMMSFPHLLKDYNVIGKPYIDVPDNTIFRKKYSKTFNVGLVWTGSPSHPHDKKRSIPLRNFKPLCLPGVKLFSLQLDLRPRQYGIAYNTADKLTFDMERDFSPNDELVDYCDGCEDMELVDCRKYMEDFDKTAELISGLDLVICCDTAIGHLAGAIGVPVWMCICFNPDWRWTLSGDKTDWYESMTLYRQSERGDWSEVVEKITYNLKKAVHEKFLQN